MTTGFVAYDELQAQYADLRAYVEELAASHAEQSRIIQALLKAKENAALHVNHTRRAEFLKEEQAAWDAAKALYEGITNDTQP